MTWEQPSPRHPTFRKRPEPVYPTHQGGAQVDNLNFFMIFYGLLLGLAMTEMLAAIAPLLREDRLTARRIGLLAPLMVALLLTEIMSSFIDAWDRLRGIEIELDDLIRPSLIGLLYFLAAAIALPQPLPPGEALDDHVLLRKGRVAATLIALNLIVLTYEVGPVYSAVQAGHWTNVTVWTIGNSWLFAAYAGLWMCSTRKWAAIWIMLALIFFAAFYIEDPTCMFADESRAAATCRT